MSLPYAGVTRMIVADLRVRTSANPCPPTKDTRSTRIGSITVSKRPKFSIIEDNDMLGEAKSVQF